MSFGGGGGGGVRLASSRLKREWTDPSFAFVFVFSPVGRLIEVDATANPGGVVNPPDEDCGYCELDTNGRTR